MYAAAVSSAFGASSGAASAEGAAAGSSALASSAGAAASSAGAAGAAASSAGAGAAASAAAGGGAAAAAAANLSLRSSESHSANLWNTMYFWAKPSFFPLPKSFQSLLGPVAGLCYLYKASRFVPVLGMEASIPVWKLRSETGSSSRCFPVLISLYKLVGLESSIAVIWPFRLSVCIGKHHITKNISFDLREIISFCQSTTTVFHELHSDR